MALPTFVTIGGFQYRGTTAFARGWVDESGTPIQIDPPASFADSFLDLLLDALDDAHNDRDTTPDADTTALEAAFAKLGREKLAYIAPLPEETSPFASLTTAADAWNSLNAKVTAILAALVSKGYMAGS